MPLYHIYPPSIPLLRIVFDIDNRFDMLHHLHQFMLERHHFENILVGEGGFVEGVGDEAHLIIEVDAALRQSSQTASAESWKPNWKG